MCNFGHLFSNIDRCFSSADSTALQYVSHVPQIDIRCALVDLHHMCENAHWPFASAEALPRAMRLVGAATVCYNASYSSRKSIDAACWCICNTCAGPRTVQWHWPSLRVRRRDWRVRGERATCLGGAYELTHARTDTITSAGNWAIQTNGSVTRFARYGSTIFLDC